MDALRSNLGKKILYNKKLLKSIITKKRKTLPTDSQSSHSTHKQESEQARKYTSGVSDAYIIQRDETNKKPHNEN